MNDNPVDQTSEWREEWIAKMMQHSRHPLVFWRDVANHVITDRLRLGQDPVSPLGPNALESTKRFQVLAERNDQGLHWEVLGDLRQAMTFYEANVADCFSNFLSYERLRIVYTGRRWYEDALRVCEAYLAQFKQPSVGSHEYFHHHALRLTEKLRKQRK
jgi:hypothetical protein